MELRQVKELYDPYWGVRSFDEWHNELHTVCGSFVANPRPGQKLVSGTVRAISTGTVEFAHVTKDIASVRRGASDIRRDDTEHLFLIIQLQGQGYMEQLGRGNVLNPGDCILIDSTKPSLFGFRDGFSNQLSVHLPRQIMLSERRVEFNVATKCPTEDPMAATLRGIIAKTLLSYRQGRSVLHFETLLYDAARLAFMRERRGELIDRATSAGERRKQYEWVIDEHLTDPDLKADWVARRLGISLRTLQNDFCDSGETFTKYVRDRRLRLAAEMLRRRDRRSETSIAEIALGCGFSDISHFNRCFRGRFHMTPSNYAVETAGGRVMIQ